MALVGVGGDGTLRLFISYRREDSIWIAGRLRADLVDHFRRDNVFFDVDAAIPLGVSFRSHIEQKVAECDVVLVVIGRQWIDAVDKVGNRRLDKPNDFVRLEVEAALARRIPVVPVLVDGAVMPESDQLPPSMQTLVELQGIAIRPDPDFDADLQRLVNGLAMHSRKAPVAAAAVPGYAVDLAFCIDRAARMRSVLDATANIASSLPARLQERMAVKNKAIRQLRVRFVMFSAPGNARVPVDSTRFYLLPQEADEFTRLVGHLTVPVGSGDGPSLALDALAMAVASPWDRQHDKRRHIVVLWTNWASVPLGTAPAIFGDAPRTMDDLNAMWGDEVDEGLMEFAAKRLLVFGPDLFPWSDISELFENCIWVKSEAGVGMTGADFDLVFDQIAGSV